MKIEISAVTFKLEEVKILLREITAIKKECNLNDSDCTVKINYKKPLIQAATDELNNRRIPYE